MAQKPVILCILDGWGIAPPGDGNPIEAADTPFFDSLIREFPACAVRASGEAVGLSSGDAGNSEVGHLTIGAGRVFYQPLPRIDVSVQNGDFFGNRVFLDAIRHCTRNGSVFHVMGICSSGNVHGSDSHIHALLRMAADNGLKDVVVHPILDGRDTICDTGIEFVRTLQRKMGEIGVGRIGTLAGRYWAMDRDNRWDRTEKAYNAMVLGQASRTATDPIAAIEESYAAKVYDEEFEPTVMVDREGNPVGRIGNNDVVVFSNYRADRARQMTKAFVIPGFSRFDRKRVSGLHFVAMAEYERGIPVDIAFPPEDVGNCLAKEISDAGLKQLHVAETEKYAHVTFFLNGMAEDPFPGEDRVIIQSPRVSSYGQAPEMSAMKIADRVVEEIQAKRYDFMAINFANADMVGHTGDFGAVKLGCQAVDRALEKIVRALLPVGGAMVITADHGNGEEVLNLQTGETDREHSTNPVPLVVVGKPWRGQASPFGEVVGGDLSVMPPVGTLADVAPTVLRVLGIQPPPDMTGRPLI
ncbi:2,3-bisphosphoglycerate-independent phosphoglycerate mutase [Candidatus Uhrbacteria bacterium]|nr:2,3-bisphosphoglycerate-independent phosphoglycerate mutase [Candidatus Uhrbacteria bacterium]